LGREQDGDEDQIINVITNVHYLGILDDVGYLPASSNTNQIIYNLIKKSLKRNLGKSGYAVLIGQMCSVSRLSENELTTNYELFEKLLNRILHDKCAQI
jgi:DNA replication protein DnaC